MKWRSVLCVFACASGRWFAEDAGLRRAGEHGGDGRGSSSSPMFSLALEVLILPQGHFIFTLTALSFDMKMLKKLYLVKQSVLVPFFWDFCNITIQMSGIKGHGKSVNGNSSSHKCWLQQRSVNIHTNLVLKRSIDD